MLITLTTDFGHQDPFVGIMKGVIAGINPRSQVIDLTHGIPAQDVMAAALTLRHAVGYFPSGTIHVVVVDPGVGSTRKPILIQANSHYFIGPDNGVLSLALTDKSWRAYELNREQYWLQAPSHTFHGRDIFAPASAHLSTGLLPAALGEPMADIVTLELPRPHRTSRSLIGKIIYSDNFGNLFTNISQHDLKGLVQGQLTIRCASASIYGVAAHYAAAETGKFVALTNSWNLLEIAAYRANARELLAVKVGDPVTLTWT